MKLPMFVLLASLSCVGQGFPELIQPDPGTGRPLRVASPCSTEPTWATPIVVYEDSDIALFVDQNCLDTSVDTGFEQNGKYMVAMYSYYKGSAGFCKTLNPPPQPGSELERECKMVGYKIRGINIDTRAKTMRVYQAWGTELLDLHGFYLLSLSPPSTPQWVSIAGKADPETRSAIEHTTKLVQKELDYWKYRLGRH